MPRISQYSTEVPGSTSRLVGNVGSTTVGFDAGQLIGAIYTSQGQITYAASSKNSTFLNPPSSNAILSYSSGSSAPAWIIGSSGQLFTVSSAGVTTVLAAPTSGAVLAYSTANGSIGPLWSVVSSGGILTGAAAGTPTWLAPPTSGAVLTYSTASSIPAWSIPTSGATLIASSLAIPVWRAIGTSGQILESTGGTPTWVTRESTIAFELQKATTQAIPGDTWTAINWEQENLDTDNVHSTASNSSLVTVPTSGNYIFGFSVEMGTTLASIFVRITEGTTEIVTVGPLSSTPLAPRQTVGVQRYFPTSGSIMAAGVYSVGSTNNVLAQTNVRFSGHRLS